MKEPLKSPLGYSYYVLDDDFITQHSLKVERAFTPDELKLLDVFVLPENGQMRGGYRIIEIDHYVLSNRRLMMAAIVEDDDGKDRYYVEDIYRINPDEVTGTGVTGLEIKRDGLMRYLESIAEYKPQAIIDPKTFEPMLPGSPEYDAYLTGIADQIMVLDNLIKAMR